MFSVASPAGAVQTNMHNDSPAINTTHIQIVWIIQYGTVREKV